MRIITFYSYKGGVGRTLACANFGLYLAKTGQKVVLADMDFEAPGLDSKFFSDATSSISNGLLNQIIAFESNSSLPNLSPITIPMTEEVTRSGGSLQLIPAGDYCSTNKYYKDLSQLDWGRLLQSEQGLSFWFDLMARIENELQPDVLVIDSRTGMTEVAGICTQVLPDTVLMLTSTSPDCIGGTKRIYEQIKSSPLIKSREGRESVDLRVVVTRVPRPEDIEAFDLQMKQRLNLEIPTLYYLFADSDLAMSEYLAMNRFTEKAPLILTDYVELFATLNPEDSHDYIESRLASFEEGLMSRDETDSQREIQELLNLFPRAEVYLAAAQYFKLVKETENSMMNYLYYLQSTPNDRNVILEFAGVCAAAPQAVITEYREDVVRHLAKIDPNLMEPQILSLFCKLAKAPKQLQSIIKTIEGDLSKLSDPEYRNILFRALNESKQWDRLVASATDTDHKNIAVQRFLAKAYAKLHIPDKALQIIHRLPMRDPTEIMPLMEILYDLRNDTSKDDIRRVIQENRRINSFLKHYSPRDFERMSFFGRDDRKFRYWIRDLLGEQTEQSEKYESDRYFNGTTNKF